MCRPCFYERIKNEAREEFAAEIAKLDATVESETKRNEESEAENTYLPELIASCEATIQSNE